MQYSQKTAFSIVFAMWFVLITSITSIYILSFIIPFSKNIKGVEFATHSYYSAYSGIEEALYLYGSGAQNKQYGYEATRNMVGSQDFWYDISSQWNYIPSVWEGNSEYDTNWNILSPSEPIQLFVGWGNIWNGGTVSFPVIRFRTPDVSWAWRPTLAAATNSWAILWQISSTTDTLNPQNNTFITVFDVNNISNIGVNFGSRAGQILSGGSQTIDTFYSSNCNSVSAACSLKFSLMTNLIDMSWTSIPYLEYQIVSNNAIPLRFSKILAEGNYNGYLKTLEVNIPQQTLNQAFDFTVFQ